MAADDVYLYSPPTWRRSARMPGAWGMTHGVPTSTIVYRQDGVWFNIHSAGVDNPIVADVDIDTASNLRLFFTKPMVVPGWLYDELAAISPADSSWTAGSLVQL